MRINVSTDQGLCLVVAKIYGPLAVHRKPEFDPLTDPDLWTVTHIQSGYSVKAGVERELAVAIAEALSGEDWDWNFSAPAECPRGTARLAEQKLAAVIRANLSEGARGKTATSEIAMRKALAKRESNHA